MTPRLRCSSNKILRKWCNVGIDKSWEDRKETSVNRTKWQKRYEWRQTLKISSSQPPGLWFPATAFQSFHLPHNLFIMYIVVASSIYTHCPVFFYCLQFLHIIKNLTVGRSGNKAINKLHATLWKMLPFCVKVRNPKRPGVGSFTICVIYGGALHASPLEILLWGTLVQLQHHQSCTWYSGDCEGLADSTSSDQQEDRYGAGDTFVCCRLLVSLPLIRK